MLPPDLKIYESMKIGIIALISGGFLWFTPAGDSAWCTPILLEQIRILSVVQQFSIQAGWVSHSLQLLPEPTEERGSAPPELWACGFAPCWAVFEKYFCPVKWYSVEM